MYSIRILHLSDLHEPVFEPWMASVDVLRQRKLQVKASARHDVLEALCERLEQVKAERSPDLVCFTGDIADWATEAEYASATTTLGAVLDAAGASWRHLLVVPGNHDIQRGTAQTAWSGIRRSDLRLAKSLSEWMCASAESVPGIETTWRDQILARQAAFWTWVEDRGLGDLHPAKSPHRRLGYRVRRLDHLPFATWVVGFDSAWLAGNDDDAGKLRLTQHQVSTLTTAESGRPLDGFRIALMHHPLGYLADGVDVRRRLGGRVELLLHGHQHVPVAEEYGQPDGNDLRILAAGSVFDRDEGTEWVNSFHLLDVDLDEVGVPHEYRVTFFSWSPTGGFWHPSNAMYKGAEDGRIVWFARAAKDLRSRPVCAHRSDRHAQVVLRIANSEFDVPSWTDRVEVPFALTNTCADHVALRQLMVSVVERRENNRVRLPLPGAPIPEFNLEADVCSRDEVDLLAGLSVQFVSRPGETEAFRLSLRCPEGFDLRVRIHGQSVAVAEETRYEFAEEITIVFPIRSLSLARERLGK